MLRSSALVTVEKMPNFITPLLYSRSPDEIRGNPHPASWIPLRFIQATSLSFFVLTPLAVVLVDTFCLRNVLGLIGR